MSRQATINGTPYVPSYPINATNPRTLAVAAGRLLDLNSGEDAPPVRGEFYDEYCARARAFTSWAWTLGYKAEIDHFVDDWDGCERDLFHDWHYEWTGPQS